MRHSELHADSGTVVNIQDPQSGGYIDLSFGPGQTHRALRVNMNGKVYVAHVRLDQIETDGEHDMVLQLRVPGGPSDAPPVVAKPKAPHPATVLPTTLKHAPPPPELPRHTDRTPQSALRVDPSDVNYHQPAKVAPEGVVPRPGLRKNAAPPSPEPTADDVREPVMSDGEVEQMHKDAAKIRERSDSDAEGLGRLTEFQMTPEEEAQLHADAQAKRHRPEGSVDPEAPIFIEDDAGAVVDEDPPLPASSVATAPETPKAPPASAATPSGKKDKGNKGGVKLP